MTRGHFKPMIADYIKPIELRQVISRYCDPTDALVNDFEAVARLVCVKKEEALVRQGELCTDFIINRCGLFRVSCVTDGKEDTLLFGTSGDVFTSLHSYYAGEPAVFSLVAVQDSEAWMISYDDMRRLEADHPVMVKWMRDLLVEQMFGFEKRYIYNNNKSAEERLLNFMRVCSGNLRRPSVKHISSIAPLKYIAQYLKITQSTLSRLRNKLAKTEW